MAWILQNYANLAYVLQVSFAGMSLIENLIELCPNGDDVILKGVNGMGWFAVLEELEFLNGL